MTKEHEKTSILIVDDEESLRNTFRIFLTRAGYENVQTVASFDEAISAASSEDFDLIICDIVLESHSGIDLLQQFNDMGITCPVVIITGFPQVETASDAVRLGAFDYIPKPVEKETLLKTARLALRQYRLEQEKKKADAARDQYRKVLETIFKSVSDTIISVDSSLTIEEINHTSLQLFSRSEKRIEAGAKLDDCFWQTDLNVLCSITAKVMQTGKALTDLRLECNIGEETKLLSICVSPLEYLQTDRHTSTGAVLVLRDITYKKKEQQSPSHRLHKMIGASPAMQEVFTLIKNIGKVDSSVLVTGASGTGKELVVDALHKESLRRDKPLIKVDCTAIGDNLLESELFGHKKGAFTGATEDRKGRIYQAKGGTLFLDEIGDISQMMQLRLLRFLQEKTYYPVGWDKEVKVDVRVIAATNADLKEKVRTGSFREDLYYRLLIIDIALPPLKARDGDIPLLVNLFIQRFSLQLKKRITGISDQALASLCSYSWPGNVRELEHIIERACVLCPETTISSAQLPENIVCIEARPNTPLSPLTHLVSDKVSARAEEPPSELFFAKDTDIKENIITALQKSGGNKAKAARMLKIDRSTLYRKIHELHIDLESLSI
ncbi:sigma-54 dependent transcriptional regulator [Desulforhopalus sp. IMCC35007]|uniref:sigma-54-dependent transcriptional regulator n=1 Tax=Desulforhopalus sp. IMCC35007 TaxID=2569543 RepID=UPI0010ADE730|nr:sigma-54 dependent transcriptional regulator [Desulforhopalus sp. IMCC35007]TKB08336.1 response regulator [Desulforhopalus sp. IMCC35007]